MTQTSAILTGLRIVEVEGLGPGPFAAMMLADLGAEVIVVHRRAADASPAKTDISLLDRGKRSIALDLKDPADAALFRSLVSTADGVIEGFRPGVMERLGLGPDVLLPLRPKLVYGRMTGWGQTGPRARVAGHDLNYIAASGALWYASPPGQPPFPPPTLVGDIGGGALYLVAGMLAGLLRAARDGTGCVVDAAIVDGSAHMTTLLMALKAAGQLPRDRGHGLLDGPHWSRCYACADGGWLSVQCLEPKFYAVFLATIGLANDPGFVEQFDPARWPVQSARLGGLFAAQPLAHWTALFEGLDACVAAVRAPEDAMQDPQVAARDIWTTAQGALQPRAAPRFDGALPPDPPPAPRRGEHSDAIRAELTTHGDHDR